jgi:outer membrane protein OmpA-like peptidoglycan-associated protein
MMLRFKALVPFLALSGSLLSFHVRAQTQEPQQPLPAWSSFKPGSGASASSAARDSSGTAGPALPASSGAEAPAVTEPRASFPVTSAPDAEAAGSVKETVLPGSEPHTPGTMGRALLDPENRRISSGSAGATGLLRVGSAAVGRRGVVRISLLGEYFTKQDFPVLGPRNTRSAGTLALDWTFFDFLETYLSYSVSANNNDAASPSLMQAQGDVSLGLKGGYEVVRGLTLGGDLRFGFFPGVGGQDLSGYAFGFSPRLLATYDVRTTSPKMPLLVHLNAGAAFDGTDGLLGDREPTFAEEFALGINRHHRLTVALGLEAPLPWATPFVEWGFGYPLGASALVGPDLQAVSAVEAMPHQLTFGAKLTAIRDVTLLAAVELGLARYVAKGVPATAPYNVVLGLSYNFDPLAQGSTRLVERTVIVEKRVEVAAAPPSFTGKIAGTVLDATTKKPIPGAIVSMTGSGLPPVASDAATGRFLTFDLPAGKVSLAFAHPGYKPAVLETTVEVGQIGALQAALVPEVKSARVAVSLVSGKNRVAGRVRLTGAKSAELSAGEGGAEIELPAGRYTATVDAPGFLSRLKEFEVPESGKVVLEVELAALPKRALVVVTDDRIQIKQQVHFASGKAVILTDSHQLLDQVVDAIVRSNIKKLRIEGHTDNRGDKAVNLKLSRERAEAVMAYLAKKGLDPSRLAADGMGDTRPIAPNLTARGRELNRRVEFVIVERLRRTR